MVCLGRFFFPPLLSVGLGAGPAVSLYCLPIKKKKKRANPVHTLGIMRGSGLYKLETLGSNKENPEMIRLGTSSLPKVIFYCFEEALDKERK